MGLKPLKESEVALQSFVVCDIENDQNGNVIDIDTAWRNEHDFIDHFLCQDWKTFWQWLCVRARQDERFRTIYAHNGGGWDWLSLIEFLLREENHDCRRSIFAVCAGSKMVVLTVTVAKRFTIRFCDSITLLRSSLDKLSHAFLGFGKIDNRGLLPWQVKVFWPDTYYAYLKYDTENLLQILEQTLDMLRKHVALIPSLGLTIGSTAMKVFRTASMKRDIMVPWQPKVKELLRDGYRGGRVECFRSGFYQGVKVYDINSLYPSVMATTDVPSTDRGSWVRDFKRGICGCYRVKFRQTRVDIPPILMAEGVGAYDNEGVYFEPELSLLLDIDPNAELEVIEGFRFFDQEKLFQNYVNKLYTLRLHNKGNPIDLICKFLLNSLYGKFGQKALRESILVYTDADSMYDAVRGGAKIRPLRRKDICEPETPQILLKETECTHEHVGIAGTITAASRVALYRGLLLAGNGLVYSDTDSVHTTSHLPDGIISDDIGDWKLEFTGDGVYAGKKLYALRDKNGAEKIRSKGVSIGGRNGASVDFNDIVRVTKGEVIETRFTRPSTPKEVFRGKPSCRFVEQKRRIRMTAE